MEFFPDMTTGGVGAADRSIDAAFLPDWSAANWEKLLDHTQTQMFSPGDIIVRAGSEERAMYLVVFGRLASFVNANRRMPLRLLGLKSPPLVAAVETGAVVNVLTFLDGQPSSMTYQARTECQLLYLNFESFTLFATRHPELGRDVLFDLGRLLAWQVRRMSSLVAAYRGSK